MSGSILGTTKILGVMGFPVSHSLSPVMHNAAIAAMGLDYVYVPFPIPVEDLSAAIAGLKAIQSVQGFNLTIPHKVEVIPLLDEVLPIAKAVGAVNTVKRVGDRWIGTNTDVAGFLSPLKQLNCDWGNSPAVILGSGGAAKAVVAACLELGCPVIHVVGRDPRKMKKFHGAMTSQLHDYNLRVHPWTSIPHLLEIAGIIINATPIGMASDPNTPISEAEMNLLPDQAIAYDLIYTPRPTKFLQIAAARGLKAIDGLEMLINQGAIGLEFWLDQPVPIEIMRQALITHLG
ncbi:MULTISPECIES: shikimate dehydrogenase [Pseudanabaena]|jgi:shikimate dehydrogenase|uniref:shikimate dehydrogenase n=1 Tax=Pseudanabaena TaxID=1152 RepID=UPI002479EB7A|nr:MULTISPECIES: shikimate dehydrogenase [Pseudanabaena]MEA5486093.1 shikimate dehydrogenase [Pseudanabaena sp. CCNP1317]WGS74320.1 shikimate dehydrogenase [Pseudanabaena galeata CCNP1313]